jgi:hypothetical protein
VETTVSSLCTNGLLYALLAFYNLLV